MHQYFSKSEETYTDEIDIVNIIDAVRQLKTAFKVLLTQNQLKIIEFVNYKSLKSRYKISNPVLENIIQTETKDRYDKLCHELDLDNDSLERLLL